MSDLLDRLPVVTIRDTCSIKRRTALMRGPSGRNASFTATGSAAEVRAAAENAMPAHRFVGWTTTIAELVGAVR